jgi:hypothetical protein
MAKQVFDQAQPRSTKAQRFADAFVGCDQWTVPPRKRRRPVEESIFDAQAVRLQDSHPELRRAA